MNQIGGDRAQPVTKARSCTDWGALSAAGGVVGGCALVSLAAQVRFPVPGSDVPMTLQLLAVLLTGLALSPRRALGAMLLYLACGIGGLPVFAPLSGGVLGPTGGYLVGFVLGAWLVSTVKGCGNGSVARLLLAGAMGTLVIFALGLAWRAGLVLFFGEFDGSLRVALMTGLLPFVGKAVIELLLAVGLVSILDKRRHRRVCGV